MIVYEDASGRGGFTLIEVLLAILIFSIIVSTIYASYVGTFRTVNRTEAQAEIYRKARVALERISEDLESVHYGQVMSGVTIKEEQAEFLGTEGELNGLPADSMRFFSWAHLVLGAESGGPSKASIYYYVREDVEGDSLLLMRRDTPFLAEQLPDESGGLILCDGLQAVDFSYFDVEGEEHEAWDSTAEDLQEKDATERIPRVVSVKLRFASDINADVSLQFMTKVVLPLSGEPQP